MYFSISNRRTHQKIIIVLEKDENEKVHPNFIHKRAIVLGNWHIWKVHRFLTDEEFESVLEMVNLRGSSSFIHRLTITDPKKWLMWSVLLRINRLVISWCIWLDGDLVLVIWM